MSETASLCLRCAQHMRTCCQTREIYVTPGDVARIASVSDCQDFCEYRVPSDPSYLDQDDDPTWATCVLGSDGQRRVLKRSPDGDCVFLGPRGCRLPLDARPLVCRLYPYEYTDQGIQDDLATGCPVHLLPPGQRLLAVLQMNLQDAQRWHKQLYREIRLERKRQCTLA